MCHSTIDQAKGAFDGKEPLRTLASYRMAQHVIPDTFENFGMDKNHVLFGQNLVSDIPGAVIRVGDKVDVLI